MTGTYVFEENTEFMQGVLDTIEEYGIAVQGIFGDEGESSFCYSVGMAEKDLPETIVCGIDLRVGQYLCNRAHREATEGTATLVPGTILTGWLDGPYEIMVCAVTDKHQANVARVIYGHNVEVVQLVMQDKLFHYPWEKGYGFLPAVQKDWFVAPESRQ